MGKRRIFSCARHVVIKKVMMLAFPGSWRQASPGQYLPAIDFRHLRIDIASGFQTAVAVGIVEVIRRSVPGDDLNRVDTPADALFLDGGAGRRQDGDLWYPGHVMRAERLRLGPRRCGW